MRAHLLLFLYFIKLLSKIYINIILLQIVIDVTENDITCGMKIELLIVSSAFDKMPLLERQRAVHHALKENMKDIHAITMRTVTPDEYTRKRDTMRVEFQ